MITGVDIINRLTANGHTALYVGGMVRDYSLGVDYEDIDIATSATQEEVKEIFYDCSIDEVGKTFGVMIINGIEVATFRTEEYEVQSKPSVKIVKSFFEDASRRDFTINAMGMDANGNIIDYFDGLGDLKDRIIRAVGDPDKRFMEDPSRILRAVYLASKLWFLIEDKTLDSIRRNREQLNKVPNELKGKIIKKVIKNNCLGTFISFAEGSGILPYIFPEIVHTVGLEQNPDYHHLDVFNHTIEVIKAVESKNIQDEEFRTVMLLTALLHDNKKGVEGIRGVNAKGLPNDLGHEEAGVETSREAVLRLGFGKKIADEVAFNVMFHGTRIPAKPKARSVLKVIRKMIPYCKNKEELKEKMNTLYAFMHCDSEGFTPSFRDTMIAELNGSYEKVAHVLDQYVFFRDELPVDGKYLSAMGIRGKEIGRLLGVFVELNFKTKEEVDRYLSKRFLKKY